MFLERERFRLRWSEGTGCLSRTRKTGRDPSSARPSPPDAHWPSRPRLCRPVGSTAASEAADPEDVRARIRPYQARLRHDIERYGGTMEKFVGDAVVAVFGAPVAHEDDAERETA